MKQLTLAKAANNTGIGLHKGEPIEIILEPLEANSGIVFFRSGLDISYKAEPHNVINTRLVIVIGDERVYISTIGYLMNAINTYGVDNVRIVLNSNEAPVTGGSNISFYVMLDEAGVRELEASKKTMVAKEVIEVRDGDRLVRFSPTKELKINYTIKFDNALIGEQSYCFEFGKKNYIEDIAGTRTFGLLRGVQVLRAMNLGLGGGLKNTIVVDGNRILDPEGLRFKDEFVRYRTLDAIGDLTLLGYRTYGDCTSCAGGRHLNHLLTKEFLKDRESYGVITPENSYEKAYEKVFV